MTAFGNRYTLERQESGWTLVRFPGIPEALTEGESEEEARADALDCVLAALEGYMKAGRRLPRAGAGKSGADRVVLVTAKLAAYETMRARLVEAEARHGAWHAGELGASSARLAASLANVVIDAAMAKTNAGLSIDLPKAPSKERAA
jgi:predicted RNase H-like HicB family nuclease